MVFQCTFRRCEKGGACCRNGTYCTDCLTPTPTPPPLLAHADHQAHHSKSTFAVPSERTKWWYTLSKWHAFAQMLHRRRSSDQACFDSRSMLTDFFYDMLVTPANIGGRHLPHLVVFMGLLNVHGRSLEQ
jgi:hypothetical protein